MLLRRALSPGAAEARLEVCSTAKNSATVKADARAHILFGGYDAQAIPYGLPGPGQEGEGSDRQLGNLAAGTATVCDLICVMRHEAIFFLI